jgi:hypothetical protein
LVKGIERVSGGAAIANPACTAMSAAVARVATFNRIIISVS